MAKEEQIITSDDSSHAVLWLFRGKQKERENEKKDKKNKKKSKTDYTQQYFYFRLALKLFVVVFSFFFLFLFTLFLCFVHLTTEDLNAHNGIDLYHFRLISLPPFPRGLTFS